MREPVTFVSWRWLSPVGYRSVFGIETVYALKAMIAKHYAHPFRFVCVTDQPKLLPGIETIPMWDDCAAIPSPFGRHNPSCYRRLKVFAPDAGKVFGPRLVSIDLDTIIVSDITPLFDRDEDFVIWGESDFPRKQWYNGSLWMLRTGTRTQVWTRFDPETSPTRAARAGCKGSDQGWINYVLGKDEATWGRKDGIYSFRKHLFPLGDVLPEDARVVSFHGRCDPWSYQAQQFKWIRMHYPLHQQVSA
jgi:hypothetical protein